MTGRASGLEAVELASTLLQRARLADSEAGHCFWEAADVQWWWRTKRPSDELERRFWYDDEGPVAAVVVTAFGGRWQCDLIALPDVDRVAVWPHLWESIEELPDPIEVPTRDDDAELQGLARGAGLVPGERDSTAWLGKQRPRYELPDGFVLVDRSQPRGTPHPMRARNGEAVEERLRSTSLYDPTLDLAVETNEGDVGGYSLYWFDPVTKIGLVEPMRVNDDFQRRGLARAMLTAGIRRLEERGAERIKIGFGTEAAGALYRSVGFEVASTATWFTRPSGLQ
jgi:ribosomal protein S18 acetylase RimI-like enzyme